MKSLVLVFALAATVAAVSAACPAGSPLPRFKHDRDIKLVQIPVRACTQSKL